MEVINNDTGTVYYRLDLDENGNEIKDSHETEPRGQKVRWHPKYRLKQLPAPLIKLASVPFLFSPNFKY